MSTKHNKGPDGQELPEHWQVFHSRKQINKYFYYNTITKKTQWNHPLAYDKTNNNKGKPKSKKLKNVTTEKNNVKPLKGSKKEAKQHGGTEQTNVPPNIKPKPLESTKSPSIKPTSVPLLSEKKFNGAVHSLPPITKPKRIRNPSEGSVSDSSDRITAWLEGTSQINFKEHPVPGTNVVDESLNKPKPTKSNQKPSTNFKSGKPEKTKEVKKVVILERVNSNTETLTKKGGNILDELLPKHATHKGRKARYTPYKSSGATSESQTKSRKVKSPPKVKEQTSDPSKTKRDEHIRFTVKQVNTKPKISSVNVFQINENDFGKSAARANANRVPQSNVSGVLNNTANLVELRSLAGDKRQESTIKDNQLHDDSFQHDEALSMDEEEGVNAAVSFSDSEVADMEIDNAEQYEKVIVQKLQQMRGNLVVNPSNVSQECDQMNITSDGYEGTLYVVLDTNVLLSHLKFVVELKDFPVQGVGMPILVIPWVVIQELDSLKDNKWKRHNSQSTDASEVEERVDMLARIAIKFLNSSFQKSDPRVRGQTIDEAAQRVGNLKEESNDDRILQCCLLFQDRAQNGNCVLFSNDRNLCNKALVNGIKAFNHQRIIPGLRDLFQRGAIVKQAYFKEYKTQLGIQEELAWRREKADEIVCELQIILREGLSYIIETEMIEAYDDLWTSIVHIKPPWTLNDVLKLLEKHWIAVFGHILKRSHKTYIEEMQKKFDDRKGTPSSLAFSAEVLELSSKIFHSFAAHSNYNDAIPKCLAAVNVLIQKCKQHQEKAPTESTPSANVQPAKCLTYGSETAQTSVENTTAETTEGHDGIVNVDSASPHNEVMTTFNLIWTAVTQFSTQIFTALGYPNSIPNELPQDFPKASKEEAIQFLGVLCPRLINLVGSIQNVLKDPWEKASQNDNLFLQLEEAIAVFLKEVMSRDNNANAGKLFGFCQDASMRTSLVQGLSQLDRASAMLQHCASCIVQPNTGLR